MMQKKIFLIHNHKNFSGAARSLGETIMNLKNKIEFIVICPKGTSSDFFKSLNIKVIETFFLVPRFNHFEIGYYRGLRWLMVLKKYLDYFIFLFFIKIKTKVQKN